MDPDFHPAEKVMSLGGVTSIAFAFPSSAPKYGDQTLRQLPMISNTPADCSPGELGKTFEFGGSVAKPQVDEDICIVDGPPFDMPHEYYGNIVFSGNIFDGEEGGLVLDDHQSPSGHDAHFESSDGVSVITLDTPTGAQLRPEVDPGNYGNIMFETTGSAQDDLRNVIIESGENNLHGCADGNLSSPEQNISFENSDAVLPTADVDSEPQPELSPENVVFFGGEARLVHDDLSYVSLFEGRDLSMQDLSPDIGRPRSYGDNINFEDTTTSHQSTENAGVSHELRVLHNVMFEMGDPSTQDNATIVIISTMNDGGDELESDRGSGGRSDLLVDVDASPHRSMVIERVRLESHNEDALARRILIPSINPLLPEDYQDLSEGECESFCSDGKHSEYQSSTSH